MGDPLGELTPRSLWQHFASIAAIPRPSKHEERIVAWVRELAARHDFRVRSDAIGNLVIDVPASAGREGAATVILQSHLDMVCEKNRGVEHDFMKDSIRPRIDGDWVYATGTTLGADNGIGVAAALAVATDPAVVHGPLQLLFTLDEETGLTGAMQLDGTLLAGKTLLNLDSEEDGILYVGCAGGADAHLHLDPERRRASPGAASWRLEVAGLRGGHSGMNIIENRGNAIKLLCRVLAAAADDGVAFDLASISGGRMHNAIPREAAATLQFAAGGEDRLRQVIARQLDAFRTELRGIDDELRIEFSPTDAVDEVLTEDSKHRLLGLLLALPHGVLAMSAAIPGMVQTSNNLAAVTQQSGRIRIVTSGRSDVAASLESVMLSVAAAGRLAGAEVETHDGYPGWKPDMSSPVLEVVKQVYRELWKQDPVVTSVHAGLECGLLAEKAPGLDMISFGPQIEGAHSPDERVRIPSVEIFWNALTRVLDALS